MFSDMSGYTALMQQNEQSAKEKRRRLKEVLETSVRSHHGKILQYYGDGALTIFNSAINAVSCSLEIQKILRQEPKVELRIGIHTGDISIEDETIFGDGVNLASRIETLALPGSIFISEKVYDEIKNQENLSATELGYFEFKNIVKPVRVYAMKSEGLVVPSRDLLKGKTKQPVNRLAVLPFVNMSADPENEFFSDGITEELLNALTKVDGLQVTSRTSAFSFKGKNIDIRDIGIQLNVDRILEGSVRKAGNKVRITTQLINAADGYHIWSEIYDRDLTDIFAVQDEISGIISNKLRENLSGRDHGIKRSKAHEPNVEAYTLYLKGLHFYNRLTPGETKKAIANFEDAVQTDPAYAQAYAMAAAGYAFLGSTGQMNPDEAFAMVRKYSDKALTLDENSAAGYMVKGWTCLFYEWNWKKAHEYLNKAIELQPSATGAYELLSLYFLSTGRKKEAVDTMERAYKFDPLSPTVNKYLADAYLNSGRVDDALKQVNSLLEMFPRMRAALELKGWILGVKGEWDKSLEIFEELHRSLGHPLKGLTQMGCVYGILDQTDKAKDCISKTEQRQKEEPGVVLDLDLAMLYWSMGEKDKAFEHLLMAVEKKMGPVAILIDHPIFKGMSEDPRYYLVKEKLNLSTIIPENKS